MIQPVTMDQSHFRVPTLRKDSRGLVVGDRALLRFAILPQVVSFFQALSSEQSLDGLASSLRILKVRSRVHGLELLVDLPVQGSYVVDRAAQIARLTRGSAYTGSWPHFVPYRDRQGPFGYDAAELVVWQNGPVFYGRHGAQKFDLDGELHFETLVTSLALQRVDPSPGGACLLRVPTGLRRSVQSFLIRRAVPASVARVMREARDTLDREEECYLFQVAAMPPRLFGLFEQMPGIEVFHERGAPFRVQRGWRHPFALESCRRFFGDAHLLLFSGTRNVVDRISTDALTFVEVRDLEASRFRVASVKEPQPTYELRDAAVPTLRGTAVQGALDYRVELVRMAVESERVTGVLLTEPRELGWLKRIVYALPQAALEEYRAAYTDQGVVIVCPSGVEWVPFGMPLKEHFPRIYFPQGTRLSPPVSYEHLASALRLQRGNVYVFPGSLERPLAVPESYFRPLVKYLLADVSLSEVEDRAPPEPASSQGAELRSAPVGVFALWRHNLLKPGLTREPAALTAAGDDD